MTTKAALIPRHDTEVLVSEALKALPGTRSVLDIGTGSGCIAIAIAKSLPEAAIVSVDISPEAIELATRNAALNTVTVDFRRGSLFEPVNGQRFDLIVSNPPYITASDIENLQPEVRDFEPRIALDGGTDGLDFYRQIIAAAPEHLEPGGCLLVETGAGQSREVTELFAKNGFSDIFTAKDPGGIERVVAGCLK
jgi:release factor glutamine methyltransferase